MRVQDLCDRGGMLQAPVECLPRIDYPDRRTMGEYAFASTSRVILTAFRANVWDCLTLEWLDHEYVVLGGSFASALQTGFEQGVSA